MGICVVLEMAKNDPENHIYEVLVLPELLCLQLHLPGKSLFLGLFASPPEVSISTMFPGEISDLGTS